jgi:2-dehydro-3-deoxyglucarate aldolase/4-hydroxy-2-oxoheptanedioate aldolase
MAANKMFNKPLIGTILSIGASQVAEVISISGFDWVMIDMEHSTLSLENVQTALQVMGKKIITIVRVPGNDKIWIKRVMDTGCDGILVPMVNSADEAREVIKSSKYPVDGERSVGLARAHNFGARFKEYLASANKDLLIMIQIEHIDGVKNIDSILKVEGIDSVFIGPYDLSASMGLAGQLSHPEVVSAINTIKDKCRNAHLPYGIFGINPESMVAEIKEGCTFVLCGVDISLLLNSYSAMLTLLNKRDVIV